MKSTSSTQSTGVGRRAGSPARMTRSRMRPKKRPCAVTPLAPSSAMRFVFGEHARRLLERLQRVDVDVLVNEDEIVVSGLAGAVVERRAGAAESPLRVVDRHVIDVRGLVAMGLDRAIETGLPDRGVVEYRDDRYAFAPG